MATAYESPYPKFQAFDSNGAPLSGGKLYTYETETTTNKTTYTDNTGTVANTNPVILDSRGEANVWLDGTYTLVLKDSSDVQIWSIDNVVGTGSTADAGGQWIVSGLTPTYVSATSFTLSGDQTSDFEVGRRIKTINSSGTVYSTIVTSSYSDPSTTVTTLNDASASMDSGLSAVSISILSVTSQAYPYKERILKQAVTHNITADEDYTLTDTQNIYGRIIITDTGTLLTWGVNIVLDNAERDFIAQNDTLFPLVFKTSAGTGIPVPSNGARKLVNNGTNVICEEQNVAIGKSGALTEHANLVIANNSGSPNELVDIFADAVLLEDSNGYQIKLESVALDVAIDSPGANGLDTGSEANSTWYHIWVISNGTDQGGLLSTSATAPTMPSGYTFKGYVGAIYNDGSGNFITMAQKNKIVSITPVYDLTSGTATGYTSVTLTVPSTAESAFGHGANSLVGSLVRIFIATTSSGMSEIPLAVGAVGATTTTVNGYFSLPLIESQTLYYKVSTGSSGGAIRTGGWEY